MLLKVANRFAILAALTACGGNVDSSLSRDPRGGAAGQSQRHEGGSPATGGSVDSGSGTLAIETGGTVGTQTVSPDTGGNFGASGNSAFAGTAGVAGASSDCTGVAGICPTGCASLPVLHMQGCGTEALRENICLPVAPTVQAPACGLRASTGEIYRLAFERPPPWQAWQTYQNLFASIADFRACNQSEIDASNCWPAEVVSTRKVTFLVTNGADADRYLVKSGTGCTPFAIQRGPDWTSLPLAVDTAWCPCTSMHCDAGGSGNFVQLVPGASATLEWDAREMQLVEELVNCSSTKDEHEPHGIPMPVGPGTYRVTVGYELDGPGYGSAQMPGVQPMCLSRNKSSQEFALPDSGDLVVSLTLR